MVLSKEKVILGWFVCFGKLEVMPTSILDLVHEWSSGAIVCGEQAPPNTFSTRRDAIIEARNRLSYQLGLAEKDLGRIRDVRIPPSCDMFPDERTLEYERAAASLQIATHGLAICDAALALNDK